MKKGQKARIITKKALKEGILEQKYTYDCTVWNYDSEKEHLYFLLEGDDLESVLMDYIYDCEIFSESERQYCEGIIKERYHCEWGNMLEIQVRNGFYKNTIKLVDKQ